MCLCVWCMCFYMMCMSKGMLMHSVLVEVRGQPWVSVLTLHPV